jgi:hypothetical protein
VLGVGHVGFVSVGRDRGEVELVESSGASDYHGWMMWREEIGVSRWMVQGGFMLEWGKG